MTDDEAQNHIQRVEGEKDRLRELRKLPGGRLSYDEAVFHAAKPALKALLSDVANLPDIPENHELFRQYQEFCIGQIRSVVDVVLQALFLEISPRAGHYQNQGRRYAVISAKHDALVPRAKHLVARVNSGLGGRAYKLRYKAVLIRTADEMNTANWKGMARDFYQRFNGDGKAAG